MYRVVVNVSGRRARLVPEGHKLATFERDFGEVSLEDAIANKGGLEEGIRGLLVDKGITNSETYTVELPDNLREDLPTPAGFVTETMNTTGKGPVTRPENPKEGEQNSETNRPEDLEKVEKDTKPKQEQSPPSDAEIKDGEGNKDA
jgi:hypothetical protein